MRWLIALYVITLGRVAGLSGHATAFTPRTIIDRYESLIVTSGTILGGCTFQRKSVLINGTTPGPVLRFKTNERIFINVTNAMDDRNFTMHWHGLSMTASPWSDGTPMISQWPIKPGSWFLYEYMLEPEHAGTYFYHSHVGLQLSTAHGPLIVEQSDAPQQFEDRILTIADWWYKDDETLMRGLTQAPWTWVGTSDHITLNGHSNGTSSNEHCSTKFPVINVRPDHTYRFRYIHAGSLMYVSIGIQGHSQSIIEVDGTDLKPHETGHIEFAPGERYSTLLRTKRNEEVRADGQNGLYLIKMSSRWRDPGVTNYAVLRYIESNEQDESPYIDMTGNAIFHKAIYDYQLPAEAFGWLDSELRPVDEIPVPENKNNTRIFLNTRQVAVPGGLFQWQVNSMAFDELDPSGHGIPFLVQLYRGTRPIPSLTQETSSLYDPESKTYVLHQGQVVDIIIINRPGPTGKVEIHPWHLHSHKFFLLAQGPGDFSDAAFEKNMIRKPYAKDTQVVFAGPGSTISNSSISQDEGGGWAVLRYQVRDDNPGVFPLHCHISPHLAMGMAAVFSINPEGLSKLIHPLLEGSSEDDTI